MIRIKFDDVVALLKPWIAAARWYRGSELTDLQCVASCALPTRAQDTITVIHLLDCDGTLFCVPLTYSLTRHDNSGLIGEAEGFDESGHGSTLTIYDATDHYQGQDDLYQLLTASFASLYDPPIWIDNAGAELDIHLNPARNIAELPQPTHAHKLTSEQSNTSIIYRFDPASPSQPVGLICKLLRVVTPGHNPDVELQGALDQAGSVHVANQYGSIAASWPGVDHADIFLSQEFLAGSVDAWQVFVTELSATGPIMTATQRERIGALGHMTREIHTQLRASFQTTQADQIAVVNTLMERAQAAFAQVPQLETFQIQIRQIYDATTALPWPELQRIHGDYHLGQVLDVPARGWVALDFEGEPLRPLAQRTQPDLALRDVAGMIRSFDYAAGVAHKDGADGTKCAQWARQAQEAFLDGYGLLSPAEHQILQALIIDKALYEVCYEAVSRPDWIDIPLAGIAKALSQN
ncbi:maltokinase N-terminal cap-like domain-containing protein [Arcanobacterium pinnipediorum]|uniref:Maltokinase n=1 Tax=Arcanobacterium pinnipediorum TaxID=1503041 RepID=A0ABY5AJ06_9ACTO|nr:hypothetical protein [Arcanobacterium pinnipediorum]USR79736.1 hypothetical protein NG665_01725 [Arcanobacterium pinnipediorum]